MGRAGLRNGYPIRPRHNEQGIEKAVVDRRRNAREFVEHRADVVLIENKNMAGSCGFACPQLTNVLTLWNSPSRSAKLTVAT